MGYDIPGDIWMPGQFFRRVRLASQTLRLRRGLEGYTKCAMKAKRLFCTVQNIPATWNWDIP